MIVQEAMSVGSQLGMKIGSTCLSEAWLSDVSGAMVVSSVWSLLWEVILFVALRE